MNFFEDQDLFSERKSDPFYEKKRLKNMQEKPLYALKSGKTQEYIIMKNDNKHHSRRCRETPSNESLIANVPYSMNSKYRFETMQSSELAKKLSATDDRCVVHEQIIRDNQAKNTLKSTYYADDIRASAGSVGGLVLGNANTLGARTATKKASRRKGSKNKELKSDSDDQSDTGSLTVYTVSKTVPQPGSKKGHGKKIKVRHGNRRLEIEQEIEEFASSASDDEVDSGSCCSEINNVVTDFSKNVSISEFITSPEPAADRKAVEKKDEDAVIQDHPSTEPTSSAFVLPKELSKCFRYDLRYKTSHWGAYDFAQEAEKLSSELPENVSFTWISSSHKAFCISFFSKRAEFLNFPVYKFTIELCADDGISISINRRFPFDDGVKTFRRYLYTKQLKNCDELVQKLILSYSASMSMSVFYIDFDEALDFVNCSFNACKLPGNERIADEVDDTNFEYWHSCDLLADPLTVFEEADLLSKVQNEHRKLEQYEKFDFEQISSGEPFLCEFCKCHVVSGPTRMNCFHNVCISCLRDWLMTRLKADAFPICCPIDGCNNPLLLEIVGALLPTVYYQFYVRRSLKHLMESSDTAVISCPACLNVGHYSKKLRYNSLKCSKCSVSFCALCGRPPHWPLNCSEAERWIPLFEETGEIVKLRLESQLRSKMVVRQCSLCGRELVAGDLVKSVSCPCCPFSFNWETGALEIPRGYWHMIYVDGKYRDAKDLPAPVLRVFCPTYAVNSKFCTQWYEAKKHRFSDYFSISSCFKCINQKNGVSCPFSLQHLKDVDVLVHFLIEYCWIWLYIHRNDDIPLWQRVYLDLGKAKKLLENLIDGLQVDALPNVVAGILENEMKALEQILGNVFTNVNNVLLQL
uniref:RING-type domain-containing protein n=1 Tax=Syphacia muris TaxID=451379 RepID=A0A0N5AI67_9BILA